MPCLSLSDLESSFKRLSLVGKTVNLVTENETGRKGFNTGIFKQIVSGDTVTAEVKHGDIFTFQPKCKMVFAMNSLPHTTDKSKGLYRRLVILPFDVTFSGENDNKMLEEELRQELDGILAFALKGLKRLRANNFEFTQSEKSQEC